MLRQIVTRTVRPALKCNMGLLARGRPPHYGSFRAWNRPSGFPDWRDLRPPVPRRHFQASGAVYAQGSKTYLDDQIRREILDNGKTYDAPSLASAGVDTKYKAQARKLVKEIGELIAVDSGSSMHELSKDTLSRHLLSAVDSLASAKKVMIFCGRNTAAGKLTPEGPVAAAIAAYALYRCHKVAIVVSDEPNRRLTQALLTELDPKCGKFLTYLPITEVNGRLLGTLSRQIVARAPDVSLYIDIPGRNSDGDYLDENGVSIANSNVAFDQALNIQNALQKKTIALCRSVNNAGFPKDDMLAAPEPSENARAVLRAAHPLLVSDVISGALGLMELVSNVCTEMKVCNAQQLEALLNMAARLTEDRSLQAPVMRKIGKPRAPWQEEPPRLADAGHPGIIALNTLHELIYRRQIVWPASFEKLKLDGPEIRYVVLFDSSDGVLIATEDFLDYVRARSNFQIKVHAVGDHQNMPYGNLKPEQLFHVVVNGISFCATLKGDVIVMICNTACTIDLSAVSAVVEKWLETMGIAYKLQLVDLVKSVAAAIVEEGGPSPVLLSTQTTAESGAYPRAIKAAADEACREQPLVKVIGCGDKEKRPRKDWATFINEGAHEKGHRDFESLMLEIDRYVEDIPLSATSAWLCCTHYPVIAEFIRISLNKRLVAHGLEPDSIRIIDPLSYQGEAMISHLEKTPPLPGRDYRALRRLAVSSTGRHDEVTASASRYIKREKPAVFDVVFPDVKISPEGAATPH